MVERKISTITPGFDKDDRSTFPYWFAHWCAFQMTALNLGVWKFKYLFHDWEKPWLRLFLPYKKVQKWHREHRRHHTNYGELHGWDKVDWNEMIIDWECCHFTKKQQPLNAPETLVELFSDRSYFRTMQENILPKLRRLINNEIS